MEISEQVARLVSRRFARASSEVRAELEGLLEHVRTAQQAASENPHKLAEIRADMLAVLSNRAAQALRKELRSLVEDLVAETAGLGLAALRALA